MSLDVRTTIRVLIIFSRLKILVNAQGTDCTNCKCCINEICDTREIDGHSVKGFCTQGCKDGYSGYRCYNKCNPECKTCSQKEYSECETCLDGKFLNTIKRCEDCPKHCEKCTSDSNCTKCDAAYYGVTCSSACPIGCETCKSASECLQCKPDYYNDGEMKDCSCPKNCLCSSHGACSECKESYYSVNSNCVHKCPEHCKTCVDDKTCKVCKDGYYIGKPYDNEKRDKVTDCSLTCRGACDMCNSYNSCTRCKQGFFGSHCQNPCSVGCHGVSCDISDGSCECREGFTGRTCVQCVAGRYGETCDDMCPESCKDNLCHKDTGNCFQCPSVSIVGFACDQCIPGTWGDICSERCPSNCLNGECVRESGFCKKCGGHFHGNKCDRCIDGYYGVQCHKECPKNCNEPYCNKNTGFCRGCKGNYEGGTCDVCRVGLYGPYCDVLCPSSNCPNNMCNRDSGHCISCATGSYGSFCELNCSQGCKYNACDFKTGSCLECKQLYSGDMCCIQDGFCQYCSSNTVCETCMNGYYGDGCDKACPAMCKLVEGTAQCDKTSGTCAVCGDGFHGDYCNSACSSFCLYNRCNKDNGHCSDGCVEGYKGPACTEVDSAVHLGVIAISLGSSTSITVGIVVLVVIALCKVLRKRYKTDQLPTNEELSHFPSGDNICQDTVGLHDSKIYDDMV